MSPPVSTERVLSTLNADGSRRKIMPRLAPGRFLRARRIVGYALIALFVALPFIDIGGRPALLIDLVTRELSLFGLVFRPTDGFLLMLLGLSVALAVFLVTALVGRAWCGWACPQTVYLEMVFRPIERLLEGTHGQLSTRGRRIVKWGLYTVLAFVLANVFLAYFVGVERLERWVIGSPADHPGGFALVVFVSALMLFDFGYFREQMCMVTCPYGRLQSVLLDKQSLIIGYDAKRGEPRGKSKGKKSLPVLQANGDCIDCGACVQVCPTGIDIRDGLQMECVGCAQCIDACDPIMDKLGRKRGLISYTSQDILAGGAKKLLRARTMIYPVLLLVVVSALVFSVTGRSSTRVAVTRIQGPAFVELPDGKIASAVRIELENESDTPRTYRVFVQNAPDAALRTPQETWAVRPRHTQTLPLFVDVPRGSFTNGKREVTLLVTDDAGFHRMVVVTLLGPS
jgi:cytochrome c oxidase accessory protein FixG